MLAIEHLNKILSYLPLVDSQDRSVLPSIIKELEEIMLEDKIPEAVLQQVTRCCKLAEHITLNETDFESGIKKLSQNVNRLMAYFEKSKPITDESNSQQDAELFSEMIQYRQKFASSQKSVLEDFEGYILSFEKNDQAAIPALKRILHTWKGEFGVLELSQFASLIHQIEESIENKKINADQLFIFKDYLSSQLPLLGASNPPDIPQSFIDKLFNTADENADTKTADSTHQEQSSPEPVTPNIPNFSELDNSLLHDFIVESRDHIQTAETALVTLESDPSDSENLNSIFRSCHTIKGVASFINLIDLSTLSHSMENVMDKCRKGEIRLTANHIDLLLNSIDCLKELIAIIEQCMNGSQYHLPSTYSMIMQNLKKAVQGNLEKNSSISENSNALPATDSQTASVISSDAIDKPDGNDKKQQEIAKAPSLPIENSSAVPQNTSSKAIEDTIRVPVQRLDQLIDAIGEAVIAQSMITADPAIRASANQALITKIGRTSMIMRQIQELSMSLRMVALRATFQKMARLVRDLGKKSGKEVHFVTDGEETELDKSVVENIGDPLIHMFRNAVDHGLESTEERVAKGKPPFGTINLRAYHKAGSVYIEIRDDGKGLDKETIFNKAVSKGLCKQDAKLTDLEIFQFIFLPGFSTAKSITDISGRGVGMDVVKRNIESLRGAVEIVSEKDKGTTFSIRLPLTLAIIDGMIVKVDNETYILPTLSIIETFAATSENVTSVLNKGEMIKVRKNLIPLIYLSSTFGGEEKRLNGQSKVAMIVEDMVGRKTALIVDEILGQQQVVIKNLGSGIGDIAGISGGAIMSDGTVSLIIDVGGIIKSVYN